MKRLISVALVVILAITLAACSGGSIENTNVLGKEGLVAMDDLKAIGTNEKVGYQLNDPKVGEEIAIMTTNMGEIMIRFFPEVAPKAVYNFKKHAIDGYYNGLTFHRVIEGFMAQAGDPAGNGTGGDSVWNKDFADEFSNKVVNLRGSIAMANPGKPDSNGSQFFINTADTSPDWSQLEMIYEDYYLPNKQAFVSAYGYPTNTDTVDRDTRNLYDELGGNLHLDGAFRLDGLGHTVFAQVFEGLDIVDAITEVEVNEDNDMPLEKIIIEKVEIVKYEG